MGKGSLDTKQERISRLIGLLRSDNFWTIEELAIELEVTSRTIQRDITALRAQGLPIETEQGRGGGVQLTKKWGIERINLSNQEVMDLLLSLAITQSMSSPLLLDNVKSIQQKLSQTFPEEQQKTIKELRKRIWVGKNASEDVISSYKNLHNSRVSLLSEAFFEQFKIQISYINSDSKTTSRIIEPHHLLLNWPVWYILAWDELREAPRMFRIDRIKNIKILNQKFETYKKTTFDKELKNYFKSI